MKLHWSPRSPFVRKVMIVLHETGLQNQVECVRSVVAFAGTPNEAVLADNPLGKIPTLVLDDGGALFDSRVICEYLDGLHDGPRLFPNAGPERFRQLRWMALADGLTDILLLWRTERTRPDSAWDVLLSAFERKTRACFERLEAEAGEITTAPFGIGHAAIICALGQMDFRFQGSRWESAFPRLAAWYAEATSRPSVAATAVVDDAPAGAPGDSVSPFTFTAA
ncbi:glutathione S-transferase [Chelativorans sp. AA-79]|uniref:glutathione S-transferase family protein n=1 Tax=Chelativorans sp. AA-79 TaxID=3028735 RepID=UPI0023F8810E|nr:glutathione S-transferase [Chelativorans sp. AA-79]WEX08718.1 glutathione S-transferase [Chelativorans sp. AA-79]